VGREVHWNNSEKQTIRPELRDGRWGSGPWQCSQAM